MATVSLGLLTLFICFEVICMHKSSAQKFYGHVVRSRSMTDDSHFVSRSIKEGFTSIKVSRPARTRSTGQIG